MGIVVTFPDTPTVLHPVGVVSGSHLGGGVYRQGGIFLDVMERIQHMGP